MKAKNILFKICQTVEFLLHLCGILILIPVVIIMSPVILIIKVDEWYARETLMRKHYGPNYNESVLNHNDSSCTVCSNTKSG